MERPELCIRGRIVALSLMMCTGKVKAIAARHVREPLCGAMAGVLTSVRRGQILLPVEMQHGETQASPALIAVCLQGKPGPAFPRRTLEGDR